MSERTRTLNLPMHTRLAPISSVNAESRTATLVWTTGARVKRFNWETGREFWEELSLDPKHVRMGRLQNGAPLLNAHNRFDVSHQIGVVESAHLERGQGVATVRFSTREDVEPIYQDVKARIIRNVSVGFVVHKARMLPPDARSEGLEVRQAVDWEPLELSLVPIAADAGASVRGAEQVNTYPCEVEELTMENDSTNVVSENERPIAEKRAERSRVRLIDDLCLRHKLPDEFRSELIESDLDASQIRERTLAELAKVTDALQIRTGFSPYDEHGHGVSQRELITEALAVRHGGLPANDQVRPFLNLRVVDVAKMSLRNFGVNCSGLSDTAIISRAISHASGDFPGLLGEAANKSLLPAYRASLGGVIQVCRRTEAPDFKNIYRLRLGDYPAPKKVLEGGEFTAGTMSEVKETFKIDTYGRTFGITRQALINDDLGAFMDLNRNAGIASAAFLRKLVADLLASNPALSDSVALFHANHGNLAGSGGAIDVTTLGAGFAAMRKQEGIDGEIVLNIEPKYLVVPAEKETIARQYVSTNYTPAKASDANPWGGQIEVVVDPRLDAAAGGTTAWYLFADPSTMPVIEYAFLSGFEGPRIETRQGFEIEGLEMKLAMDVGAGVVDYRGAYKNAGA